MTITEQFIINNDDLVIDRQSTTNLIRYKYITSILVEDILSLQLGYYYITDNSYTIIEYEYEGDED